MVVCLKHTIFELAQELVRRYDTRNPFEIAESLGVEIMYSDNLRQLKGMYLYILRNPFIVINSNLSEAEQRIVCAHELGHDRLHRALARQGAMQEISLFDMAARPEYEANIFAAELLLSDGDMIEAQNYCGDVFAIAMKLESDVNLITLKVAEMEKRGYPFSVDTTLYDRRFMVRDD